MYAYIAISLFAILYLTFLLFQENYSFTGFNTKSNVNVNDSLSVKSIQDQLTKKTYKVYVNDLPYKIDPKYKNSVDDAIAYWEAKENVDFVYTDNQEDADLIIYWAKDFSVGHVGYAYESLIEIGLGDSYCYNEWRPYSYDYISQTMKHEFGHFLGYDHSQDENDLMYSTSKQEYDFILNESDVLPQGYYQFYGFCSLSQNPTFLINIDSDDKADYYIIPSYDDYVKMIDGDKFEFNEECSLKNTKEFSTSCKVTNTSGIVIVNERSTSPLFYSINVSEQF